MSVVSTERTEPKQVRDGSSSSVFPSVGMGDEYTVYPYMLYLYKNINIYYYKYIYIVYLHIIKLGVLRNLIGINCLFYFPSYQPCLSFKRSDY